MLGEIAIVLGADLHLPLRLSAVPIDKPVRSLRVRSLGWLGLVAAQEGLLRLAELVSCGLCCLLLSGKGAQVFAANHGLPWLALARAPGGMEVFDRWHYDNSGDLCALGPCNR